MALGQGAAQVTDTSSAITALRSLAALYKAIVQAVKDEAIIMEQVFPAPGDALVMFVTRLYEQRVQVNPVSMEPAGQHEADCHISPLSQA